MHILIINAHLTYPGWSDGKLNNTLADIAKAFFTDRETPSLKSAGPEKTFDHRRSHAHGPKWDGLG